MQLSIIWHILRYNVKLYARLSSRLCACVLTPRSLQDTISPLNEKFWNLPEIDCLVVIFPVKTMFSGDFSGIWVFSGGSNHH